MFAILGQLRGTARHAADLAAATVSAIAEVAGAVKDVGAAVREGGLGDRAPQDVSALQARLDELERTRALWEAEMEAAVMRAQNERRTARAAEQRAIEREKRINREEPDDAQDDEGTLGQPRLEVAPPSHAEEMQPVRQSVGAGRKGRRAAAVQAKWGGR